MQRADVLIGQRRYKEAMEELQQALAYEPGNGYVRTLMGLCLLNLKRNEEAETVIKEAIGISPNDDVNFYLLAMLEFNREDYKKALGFIDNAISLSPFNAQYFAVKANIYLQMKQWEQALGYADHGLACDPEHVECLNLRATALTKLGRKEESYDTIHQALNYDPENDMTHANTGWSMLEQGEHVRALESFRQALMLNPNNDWAKQGMIEALKARNVFYRWFLKYSFWMSNQGANIQWAVLIGFVVGRRVLVGIANANPTLGLILWPLVYILLFIAISSWVIMPVSNLFLRFNKYGKYALTKNQVTTSNFVAGSLGLGVLAVVAYLCTGYEPVVSVIITGFTMMIPLAVMLVPIVPSHRMFTIGYTIVLGVLAVAMVTYSFVTGELHDLFNAYLIAWVAFGWIYNFMTRPKF